MKLIEMCVRLRSASGRGEELGGVQESGAEVCVCVELGELFRGNKPPSLERKMSRMPVVTECKANLEQQ